MLSPAQLRRLIEQAHADEATLRSQANLVAEQRALLEKMLERAEASAEPLTSGTKRTNVRDTMQAQVLQGRRVGRPIESDHPFPAWLRSTNVTVTEWADEHNDPDTGKPYKRERVKSWFADGAGGRPAPRHAVDVIERESTDPETKKSAVPATKRVWKNGIRE